MSLIYSVICVNENKLPKIGKANVTRHNNVVHTELKVRLGVAAATWLSAGSTA